VFCQLWQLPLGHVDVNQQQQQQQQHRQYQRSKQIGVMFERRTLAVRPTTTLESNQSPCLPFVRTCLFGTCNVISGGAAGDKAANWWIMIDVNCNRSRQMSLISSQIGNVSRARRTCDLTVCRMLRLMFGC
jgi:hypothetical protein